MRGVDKELAGDELNRFLDQFEEWLKSEKGLSGFPGAKWERQKVLRDVERLVQAISQPTVARVLEYATSELTLEQAKNGGRAPAIEKLIEYLRTIFVPPEEIVKPSEPVEAEVPEVAVEIAAPPREIIGRVALTLRKPATASEFTFWIRADESVHIEPGQLITASAQANVSVVGIISDVEAASDIETPLDSFYGHSYGRPDEELATTPTVVTTATAEVVFRSDRRLEPPRGNWPVYFATAPEIRQAYGAADIPEQFQVCGGFTYDDRQNPVAIPLDARFILGYEAAHVNIAGASGAAAKTSYGLFLLQNLLVWGGLQSKEVLPGGVAAIAFNVKEADLMRIDDLPPWDEAHQLLQLPRLRDSFPLWRFCRENLGIDPYKLAGSFRFFAPSRVDGGLLTFRTWRTRPFNYGLMDLLDVGSGALLMLLDPRDIDDLSTALIYSLADHARDQQMSFRQLFASIHQLLSEAGPPRRGPRGTSGPSAAWVTIGGVSHHPATIYKVLNRLQNTVQYQLRGLLSVNDLRGNPIPLHELRRGELWVIDISHLNDKGQRMIFHHIITLLQRILEAKKSGERQIVIAGTTVDATFFPDRVAVMVDELNKFAPAGREFTALKADVIDIAARGRSIGLGMIGIQQMASNVDDEILANASTFVVGRTHTLEIRKTPYSWLAEGLRGRATVLEKGWVLLWHSVHKRPVLVRFPIPLHFLRDYAAIAV
jgi:DNA helicase HerA-like ATPase